jgi:histidinol dehydrogenase
VANTRKVKAEVINSSVIRITAPKSNAEYAANDIEQLLQSTTTHKFRLRDWEKANLLDKERIPANGLVNIYTSESLQVIGKASGAYIQSVSNDMVCYKSTYVVLADYFSSKSER